MATLFDLAQRYLNQGMPDISPIFSNTGITSTPTITPTTAGVTPQQLDLLYPQRTESRDNDGFRGGGAFGNLDTTNTKDFEVATYNEDTGEYDILDTVQGFYNPSLGQYQTYDGKNITHAGINFTPGIVSLIGGLTGFDFGPKQGDIGSLKALADLKNFIEIQKKEKKSQIVEDPADYLERKEKERKQKEFAKVQAKIGQSLHGDGGKNKGKDTDGTFGSSVNDPGSFSDYS